MCKTPIFLARARPGQVGGETLRQWIALHPSPEPTARLAEDLLAGIDYTERKPVIHKDLKPPGDAEIRTALLARLGAAHQGEDDTVFFEELGLCRGQVRADVAVVNGSLHGYEIKSDRDTLRRLAAQVDRYSRVFDRVTLVVGPRHCDEALTVIPPWWELQVADLVKGAIRLQRRRRGRKNVARNARTLVELLWLDDAIALIEARCGARGYRSRPRRDVWDRVCELYTLDEIAGVVRGHLKAKSGVLGRRRFA